MSSLTISRMVLTKLIMAVISKIFSFLSDCFLFLLLVIPSPPYIFIITHLCYSAILFNQESGNLMKLIDKKIVSSNFNISNWLKEIGFNPNFEYAKLTTYSDSPVYSLFRLVGDSYLTYTIVVIDNVRYVFEMTKGSRDVVSEFEEEIKQTVLPTDGEVELD